MNFSRLFVHVSTDVSEGVYDQFVCRTPGAPEIGKIGPRMNSLDIIE